MMLLSEIANALNANMIGPDMFVSSIGTDSRCIAKDQLFVGLKGERFDGNKYASKAIKDGASAVVVSDASLNIQSSVVVKDTRLALGEIARFWRKKFNLPLVAVTGSNGKTTVKEMIAAILRADGKNVLYTEGNLNNDIGVPLTLLKINTEHAYAVIEMGMSHEGEIRYLTNIAMPSVAIVNNAGSAHIGEVGSLEAIARAKGEIFESLDENGIAIINADDDFADYWKRKNKQNKIMTFGLNVVADISATFEIKGQHLNINLTTPNGSISFDLKMQGKHNVSNALAASAVAFALGVSNNSIANGLKEMGDIKGRLTWLPGFQGATVIDDTYNANPDSMKAAIDVLANQQEVNSVKGIFVMADMAELGDGAASMHKEIGRYAKLKNISKFYTFGNLSQLASDVFGTNAKHFQSLDSLIYAIKSDMQEAVAVLVKGSRSMRMERVVDQIVIKQVMARQANKSTKLEGLN